MSVLGLLVQCIMQCFSWFEYIMTQCNTYVLWLGVFAICTVYRFVLAPIMGATISSGASDFVNKNIKSKKPTTTKKRRIIR